MLTLFEPVIAGVPTVEPAVTVNGEPVTPVIVNTTEPAPLAYKAQGAPVPITVVAYGLVVTICPSNRTLEAVAGGCEL